MRSVLIILILTAACLNQAIAQNDSSKSQAIQQAIDDYSNKDYSNAFRLFSTYKNSKEFSAMAKFCLGILYRDGLGTAQNYNEAFTWCKSAADEGLVNAEVVVAVFYLNGNGVTKDEKETVKWLRKASEQNNGPAQYLLCRMIEEGAGTEKNKTEALRQLRLSAKNGYADAQKHLKELGLPETDDGRDNAINFNKKTAALSEKETIELGVKDFNNGQRIDAYQLLAPLTGSKYFTAEAEACMGDFYQEGVGSKNGGWPLLKYDYTMAMKWYKKAAADGNADAMAEVGVIYSSGSDDIKQNEKEAFKWYKKSAEKGSGLGQDILGTEYTTGKNVPIDQQEAIRLYRLSAAQGCGLGMLSLAGAYSDGSGVEKDMNKAIEMYIALANMNTPANPYAPRRAAFLLNQLGYSAVSGTLLNPKEEIALGLDACSRTQYEVGFKLLSKHEKTTIISDTALNWLGFMYDHGYGTTENIVEAFDCIKRAAEMGNSVAQNNLAGFYHAGRGTSQNYAEALKWYSKSGLQDNWDAQVSAGLMYTNGEGVKKDDVKAVEWYRKAALLGWGWGQYYLGLAYRNGTGVAVDDAKSQLLLGYAAGHGVAAADALYVKKETYTPEYSDDTYSNNTPAAKRPVVTRQTPEIYTRCIACGGSGWVDGSDNLGHSIRKQCTSCGGSGKVRF